VNPGPTGSLVPDVRFRAVRKYVGARGTTYTVPWSVNGKMHQRTFSARKLADVFRSELQVAARSGVTFSLETGLPQERSAGERTRISWYTHACEFTDHKWPQASPRHRKGLAEALTDLTLALVDQPPPDRARLRRLLYSWSFNAATRQGPVPADNHRALKWIEAHSLPLANMEQATTLRTGLEAISRKQDGSPAAPATVTRKRSAFYSALQFAVELEYFVANPLDRVSWRAPVSSDLVDRRVVVNPDQARALLRAVRGHMPALEAFFACLYYAGLRPAEAVNLRAADCELPESGWGSLLLSGSYQVSGSAWSRTGTRGEEQALKHRARKATRRVPAHPELVATLRAHLAEFGTGVDGRLFVNRTGKAGTPLAPPFSNPLAMNTAYRVWGRARVDALSPEQVKSPLAQRPYDLRHACLSTWLNAGVPATQVADWAGHSVNVLLKVYASCIVGQDEASLRRIESALVSLP
jgi:integrase